MFLSAGNNIHEWEQRDLVKRICGSSKNWRPVFILQWRKWCEWRKWHVVLSRLENGEKRGYL